MRYTGTYSGVTYLSSSALTLSGLTGGGGGGWVHEEGTRTARAGLGRRIMPRGKAARL